MSEMRYQYHDFMMELMFRDCRTCSRLSDTWLFKNVSTIEINTYRFYLHGILVFSRIVPKMPHINEQVGVGVTL